MFKNSESPISLFSFQDIITSLTGIMLFFMLILAISMLEMAETTVQAAPLRDRKREVRQQNQLLQEQIREMTGSMENYRKDIRTAAGQDPTMQKITIERLEEELAKLRRHAAEQLRRQVSATRLREQEQLREKQLETGIKTASEQQARLRRQQESLQRKRKQLDQIRNEIAQRRHTVNIMLDRKTTRKPVLIECSRDRISISTNRKRQWTVERRSPSVIHMIDQLCNALKEYSAEDHYFIFLLKPSSAQYLRYLQMRFAAEIPNAESGMEPILESEEVL